MANFCPAYSVVNADIFRFPKTTLAHLEDMSQYRSKILISPILFQNQTVPYQFEKRQNIRDVGHTPSHHFTIKIFCTFFVRQDF